MAVMSISVIASCGVCMLSDTCNCVPALAQVVLYLRVPEFFCLFVAVVFLLLVTTKIRREKARADDLVKKIKAEAEAARTDEKMIRELEELRNDKNLLKDNLQVQLALMLSALACRLLFKYQRTTIIGGPDDQESRGLQDRRASGTGIPTGGQKGRFCSSRKRKDHV